MKAKLIAVSSVAGVVLGTWLIWNIPAHKAAADAPPITTFSIPDGTVTVVEDRSRGNACYVVQPGGGISCVWMSGWGR